jgi:hypothetical protein
VLLLDLYNDIFLRIASKQENKPIMGVNPALVGATSPTLAQILLRGKRLFNAINIFDDLSGFEKLCSDVLSQVSLSEFSGSDSSSFAARQLLMKGMRAAGGQMYLFLSTPASMQMVLPFIPSSTDIDLKELETDADEVRNRRRQDRRFEKSTEPPMDPEGCVTPFAGKAKVVSLANAPPLSSGASGSGSTSTPPSSSGSTGSTSSTGSLKSACSLKNNSLLHTPFGILNLREAIKELGAPKMVSAKDWGFIIASKKGGLSHVEALKYSRWDGNKTSIAARKVTATEWAVILTHFH